MKDRLNPNSSEPYYQNNQYHPLASDPIFQPECNSITVNVYCLQDWEWDWSEAHLGCGDVWGQIPGREPVFDGDGNAIERLLACNTCGEERPVDKNATITVTPATGDFVTVHDYVSTVQPWLMQLRGDIEKALVVHSERLSEDLVVGCDGSLTSLVIEEKKLWLTGRPAYEEPTDVRWIPTNERPLIMEQENLLGLMAAARARQMNS